MRTKIEYTINNRSKLVEKLILFEDKNNSQFNNESYYTWKRLAEECSKSGDISMFANGFKENLKELASKLNLDYFNSTENKLDAKLEKIKENAISNDDDKQKKDQDIYYYFSIPLLILVIYELYYYRRIAN